MQAQIARSGGFDAGSKRARCIASFILQLSKSEGRNAVISRTWLFTIPGTIPERNDAGKTFSQLCECSGVVGVCRA
jgi:hypothetical protein